MFYFCFLFNFKIIIKNFKGFGGYFIIIFIYINFCKKLIIKNILSIYMYLLVLLSYECNYVIYIF